jgi:NAD(P)-dependent dehydrogenase (short-subunit alcohol dehydrogenase family)
MQTASPVALVTGASSGIGRAAARAFVDAGFAVVGTSRNAANASPIAGVSSTQHSGRSPETYWPPLYVPPTTRTLSRR